MFERFTERARQVVVLGQEEARLLKHDYIGTEHLLLGLLREEHGIGARVLDKLSIGIHPVREMVINTVGEGPKRIDGQIPFTPRAKKMMELALREALSLGHNYIGTEHLILALTRDSENTGMTILGKMGTDAGAIHQGVMQMLAPKHKQPPPKTASAAPPPASLQHQIGTHLIEAVRLSMDLAAQKLGEWEQGRK